MNLKFPRDRDCHCLFRGDSYPVVLSTELIQNGWFGGSGVQWDDSPRDEFRVRRSNGEYGGFILFGSGEPSDEYTALTGNQLAYGHSVMCSGGWLISTRAVELFTYVSRQAGPLVPLSYQATDRVLFSLRGLWTKEDEWTLAGDPRGANDHFVGSVIQPPSSQNNWYITIQTSI